ncbi:MAG: hypothetical protein IPM30_16395, partial [Burkholderiales bacterium]|nr:hypothetical protein [Burkholderiales bacterium]
MAKKQVGAVLVVEDGGCWASSASGDGAPRRRLRIPTRRPPARAGDDADPKTVKSGQPWNTFGYAMTLMHETAPPPAGGGRRQADRHVLGAQRTRPDLEEFGLRERRRKH